MEETEGLLSAKLMRNNARLRVLAEVANSFAIASTDYHELLNKIAFTAADLIGDGCVVTLVEDGIITTGASAHRNARLYDKFKIYADSMRIPVNESNAISAQVVRTGEPMIGDIDPQTLVDRSDENLKALLTILNVHSYAIVPVRVRNTVIGTLSLIRSVPGHSYDKDDVTLLQDLAARAGLAIENVRLYMQLDARVKQRTSELEFLNKELESFSYSVAHDLRAPLRSVDGYSQILLNDYGDGLDDEGRELLKKITDSAKRMNQLIEDLLKLSQVSRSDINKQKINLSELVEDIFYELQNHVLSRKIEIVIQPNVFCVGDFKLLEIALTNLIGNSWKFTRYTENPRIKFGSFKRASKVVYYVRDNGAGFDVTHAEKLFMPFQRMHNAKEFEGIGVGLAIVQRIINRHGGAIRASAKVNKGATFYFTLS